MAKSWLQKKVESVTSNPVTEAIVNPTLAINDALTGGAVGDFIGGTISDLTGQTAEDAAEASAQAAREAAAVQKYMYETTRGDIMPNILAGRESLYSLHDLMGIPYYKAPMDGGEYEKVTPEGGADQIKQRPGYQFRLEEGLKALDRSAAGRGGFGGRNLKDMMRYGQDYASQEFGNEYSRLAQMAGMGSGAAQNLGTIGAKTAANQGEYIQNAGDARASGYMGAANARQNLIGTGLGLWAGM